jgi:hypothetical protein
MKITWKPLQNKKDGILVGCSKEQEFLLPFFWFNYKLKNELPVVFTDFGMSEKAKKWCEKRGTLHKLKIEKNFIKKVPNEILKKWQKYYKGDYSIREKWVLKPFAMINSPFYRTIWIDLDCEIRGTLKKIFKFCENPAGLSIVRESDELQKYFARTKIDSNKITYNSGVVVFKHGSSVIKKWCEKTEKENHLFLGDQNILSSVLQEKKYRFKELPKEYNWLVVHSHLNEKAVINHWTGHKGKIQIIKMMECLEKLNILEKIS